MICELPSCTLLSTGDNHTGPAGWEVSAAGAGWGKVARGHSREE